MGRPSRNLPVVKMPTGRWISDASEARRVSKERTWWDQH